MHDPMAVAHEIATGKWFQLTIWHIDPETDGTDDSCGWFHPRLTEQDLTEIERMVKWDLDSPFYTSKTTVDMAAIDGPDYPNLFQQTPGDCLGYVAAAWQQVAWYKGRRQSALTIGEWWEVAVLSTNPVDNIRHILADPDISPEERARHFLWCVMRCYLRHHRSWWRHPRWHIHHWRIQVHFVQMLKRWLFSRCACCEKRFTWGYSPISTGNGQGPLWFKSETYCFHHGCRIPRKNGVKGG